MAIGTFMGTNSIDQSWKPGKHRNYDADSETLLCGVLQPAGTLTVRGMVGKRGEVM